MAVKGAVQQEPNRIYGGLTLDECARRRRIGSAIGLLGAGAVIFGALAMTVGRRWVKWPQWAPPLMIGSGTLMLIGGGCCRHYSRPLDRISGDTRGDDIWQAMLAEASATRDPAALKVHLKQMLRLCERNTPSTAERWDQFMTWIMQLPNTSVFASAYNAAADMRWPRSESHAQEELRAAVKLLGQARSGQALLRAPILVKRLAEIFRSEFENPRETLVDYICADEELLLSDFVTFKVGGITQPLWNALDPFDVDAGPEAMQQVRTILQKQVAKAQKVRTSTALRDRVVERTVWSICDVWLFCDASMDGEMVESVRSLLAHADPEGGRLSQTCLDKVIENWGPYTPEGMRPLEEHWPVMGRVTAALVGSFPQGKLRTHLATSAYNRLIPCYRVAGDHMPLFLESIEPLLTVVEETQGVTETTLNELGQMRRQSLELDLSI